MKSTRRRAWTTLATVIAVVAGPGRDTGLCAQVTEDRGIVTTLGLGFSMDWFGSRDLLISRRPWTGGGVTQNGFFLSFRTARSWHEINGWFGTLDTSPGRSFEFLRGSRRVSTVPAETDVVDASYTWLERVEGRWWLGVSATAQAMHTRYEMGTGAAEGFLYYAGLAMAGRREVGFGPGRSLTLSLRIPLLGWVARSPYSTVDEARLQANSDVLHRLRHGEISTPDELQAVSGRAAYTHLLREHVGLHAAARLAWVRFADGPDYSALRAGLDLGLVFQWSGGAR